MRAVVAIGLAGIVALLATDRAAAVTLATAAEVRILPAAGVSFDPVAGYGAAGWTLLGEPGDRILVTFEVRDLSGRRLASTAGTVLAPDPAVQPRSVSPAPTAVRHLAWPVLTLVICRE
ncbi:MAG TPA: hypothetical protein PLL30_08440 [Candidatus Krumholzibacteria bacterium]|nr:hypothetical protein [Candidatus Krumholzibacteria bacterium]HPD71786.1 hypothetical protein [Candidatus Krumholzibacteria bacterium]HRY41281.1 hypothetical protein [Candidatus Krumholzibacteria bacterium]